MSPTVPTHAHRDERVHAPFTTTNRCPDTRYVFIRSELEKGEIFDLRRGLILCRLQFPTGSSVSVDFVHGRAHGPPSRRPTPSDILTATTSYPHHSQSLEWCHVTISAPAGRPSSSVNMDVIDCPPEVCCLVLLSTTLRHPPQSSPSPLRIRSVTLDGP